MDEERQRRFDALMAARKENSRLSRENEAYAARLSNIAAKTKRAIDLAARFDPEAVGEAIGLLSIIQTLAGSEVVVPDE
jgi:hypothetical protein